MNTTGGGPTDTAPIHLRWEPAQSYPDPAVQTLDPRFDAIKPPMNSGLDRVATGFRELAATEPTWVLIDGCGSVDEVFARVQDVVSTYFA